MAQYVFDHNWKKERERLANIERMLDPFTIQRLESFGVGAGWRCLEVGAGGGTQPSGTLFKLTFERLRDRVVEAGLLSAQDADQFLTDIQSPEFTGIGPISFAAWGQKKVQIDQKRRGSHPF